MKKGFTHKELTLLAGILVAVIVIFTWWVNQPVERASIQPIIEIPKLSITEIAKTIAQVSAHFILK